MKLHGKFGKNKNLTLKSFKKLCVNEIFLITKVENILPGFKKCLINV